MADARTVAQPHAVVFLREEEKGPFVPFYHPSSITLREVQEEFHISSVLECDQGGNVLPRAVAFDSPSDVLRSGRHYIAKRDVRQDERGVTFKSKIVVKEYDVNEQQKGSRVCQEASGGNDARPRPGLQDEGKENLIPGHKRFREVARNGFITSRNVGRFVPFTADLTGSGANTLITLDTLRELCKEDDPEGQAALYARKHTEAMELIEKAKQLL